MKKVALIVDVDNWAYANIANNFKKNLSQFYDITVIPTAYLDDNITKTFLVLEDCDLVHIFWRGKLLTFDLEFNDYYLKKLGLTKQEFIDRYIKNKIITTAVYDHLYLDEENLNKTKSIVKKADAYYVSSERLFKIYNELDLPKKPTTVITDGVDLNKFYPLNEERYKNIKNREIVIGWCGNSLWEAGTEDFKGVNTILKPAIKELNEEGYKIKTYFADKQERMIPHNKMNDYYSNIDIYICTSKIEGTPNPVLESMAAGIPIISTDVGIVPELFGEKQKEYILKERSKDELKKKLRKMIDNIDKIDELRQENLKEIEDWTWKKISYKMKKFLDERFVNETNKDYS